MNFLILHQNFPGQFKLLAKALSEQLGWRVVGLGQRGRRQSVLPTERYFTYPFAPPPPKVTPALRHFEDQVARGEAVRAALIELKRSGFEPDGVIAHPGWGETLFLRDVFPKAKFVSFLEFYYNREGADADFDPEFPTAPSHLEMLKLWNLSSLMAFAEADRCVSPTRWQASLFPLPIRERVTVLHEGVDTDAVRPDPSARLTLPNGRCLTRDDQIITYVARTLEPYRGFHRFMRALPELQRRWPEALFLVIGADGASYGQQPSDAPNWRMKFLRELSARLDLERLIFTGPLPYASYLSALSLSSAHIYLTYPFVLSWSLIEAMASGCAIIGSRTAPVEEVIRSEENGLLVDFFDEPALVDAVDRILGNAQLRHDLGTEARRTATERFDFSRVSWPAYRDLLQQTLCAGDR